MKIQETVKTEIIIVDIDGTLALKGDRDPFDWMNVGKDLPNYPICDLVRRLAKDYRIILFSGRKEQCRMITEDWLEKQKIKYLKLYMRADNDNRSDIILKKELFDNNIRSKYLVQFVLDDRNQVVDMWRNELHLTCLQVAEGNF